ncbi:TPA: LysR family transcriptional regulator [Pseudomonas aeruginosa]
MSPIDLNLIRTFVTLYEAGSVTLAAERLFVTQPSVSYALARLRELFDDALFTRTRDGIQPTFVAEQLYGTFRESLTRIEGAVQSVRHFDPATTERRFRIALTDLGERYVCLLSDRHPRIGDSLSLEQYLAERHIVVTRTSGHGIAEDVLEAMQVRRRISLRVPHFSVLPKIIPGTELLTILPAQIAYRFVAEGGMRMLELPFTLPPFDVSLHWHESSERSAALNWFRTTIAEAIIAAQR